MKEFLAFVMRQLVDHSTDVRIEEARVDSDQRRNFRLVLPASEIGKIIGKQGHTIRAVRTLLEAAGDRHGERIFFEVAEQPTEHH